MYKPVLQIDLYKLTQNARIVCRLLAEQGIEMMGVNKVFDGCIATARALLSAGINTIAESRTYNLRQLKQKLGCKTCLLRSPCLSEIKEVISYADISLNSEEVIIQALAREAQRQGKEHQILLMIDMGDLREGIWFEDYPAIVAAAQQIIETPGLTLYGIGTNFNCYGSVIPSNKNNLQFVKLAGQLEQDIGYKIHTLSAGNCTSYHLVDKGQWLPELNQLRVGGLHQFGIEYVAMKYLDELYHSSKPARYACSDLYCLEAEVIEINTKPTMPFGELGTDAFLQQPYFIDKGKRKRALLAFGRQDVPIENCVLQESTIAILGQTSDHTIVDIEDYQQELCIGDSIRFELDYTGLLMACQAPGVRRRFKRQPDIN